MSTKQILKMTDRVVPGLLRFFLCFGSDSVSDVTPILRL